MIALELFFFQPTLLILLLTSSHKFIDSATLFIVEGDEVLGCNLLLVFELLHVLFK